MENNNTFWKTITGRSSYFILLVILLFQIIILHAQYQLPKTTKDGYPITYDENGEAVMIGKPIWKAIEDDRKKLE